MTRPAVPRLLQIGGHAGDVLARREVLDLLGGQSLGPVRHDGGGLGVITAPQRGGERGTVFGAEPRACGGRAIIGNVEARAEEIACGSDVPGVLGQRGSGHLGCRLQLAVRSVDRILVGTNLVRVATRNLPVVVDGQGGTRRVGDFAE